MVHTDYPDDALLRVNSEVRPQSRFVGEADIVRGDRAFIPAGCTRCPTGPIRSEADLPDPTLVRRALRCDLEPAEVLLRLRGDRHPFALDGRWSCGAVAGSDPVRTRGPGDPLRDVLGSGPVPPSTSAEGAEEFHGGWVGYLGYGLGRAFNPVPQPPGGPRVLPEWWFGYYDHVLRRDAQTGRWHFEALVTPQREAAIEQRYTELSGRLRAPATTVPFTCGEFSVIPGPDDHIASVARVIELIKRGDIFQANLCLRLETGFTGEALDLFCRGVRALRPHYAAFIQLDDGAVASFSPELFLRRHGRDLLTRPIKGTCHRPADAEGARSARETLERSAKDRAENIMIVDLMRSDFGRVCDPGTVAAPTLAQAEAHPGLWHLVSDVQGQLSPLATDSDVVAATFPPGSVTGAPKVRAMEVIHETEATARETYTGAIGYRSAHGMEFNVAIRTFEFHGGRVWLGTGGGITARSSPSAEYQECLLKARPLLEAIGGRFAGGDAPRTHPDATTIGLRPRPAAGVFTTTRVTNGAAADLPGHLARLALSAQAVFGKPLPGSLPAQVRTQLATRPTGRLRITVRPVAGHCVADVAVTDIGPEPHGAYLHAVCVPGGLGGHKWLDRRLLASLSAQARLGPGGFLLITDTDGSVLECDRGNIFAVIDGVLRTPPADGSILPGVTRSRVLAEAAAARTPVHVAPFHETDLLSATEVFTTNSVHSAVPVLRLAGRDITWPEGPLTRMLAARLAHLPERLPAAPQPGRPPPPAAWPQRKARPAGQPRILLIDNYDSFTYNLADLITSGGAAVEVVRNDEVTAAQIAAAPVDGVIISPGPCAPPEAGVCVAAVRELAGSVPILGVCLGHQVIAVAYGAALTRTSPVHGRTSAIVHDGAGIFAGVPPGFEATRYHSLLVDETTLPGSLRVTARTPGGLLMGLRHATHPVEGVQFHPESVLTPHGHLMITNFVRAASRARSFRAETPQPR